MIEIRKFNDPALSAMCDPVQLGESMEFLKAMREVCKKHSGVGLAAPQIGVLKRAVLIMPLGWGRNYTMLNPVITRHSQDVLTGEEGCLSYPGIRAQVERWKWIEVDFRDRGFVSRSLYLSGWEARIVQHEVDHLDGICKVGDAWKELAVHDAAGEGK